MRCSNFLNCGSILGRMPHATAVIGGSTQYPAIAGLVRFFQTDAGVVVATEVTGLPALGGECATPVFGFHIHGGGSCTGNAADPFVDAMTHYNPDNCPHPYHAGDLPPLSGNNGFAFSVVLTNRFTVSEIIGKTVIIHSKQDDFTTQPAENSGDKIACGVIRSTLRSEV